jgi:hypothetical protein
MADGNVVLHQVLTNEGVPASVYAFTVELVCNETGAVALPAGTPMKPLTPGVYEYQYTPPAPGLTYTANYSVQATAEEDAMTYSHQCRGDGEWRPPKPRYTGRWLEDTLHWALWQRQALLMSGFQCNHSIHGHVFHVQDYMDYLNRTVMQLRVELAEAEIVEQISAVGGCDYGDW